jgi:tRNA nucleotidyltransferase (CCA-adding enzyme)
MRKLAMTDDPIYPDVARILAERQELIRQCAARVLRDHAAGQCRDAVYVDWARGVVARVAPLDGPLSDGVARNARLSRDQRR